MAPQEQVHRGVVCDLFCLVQSLKQNRIEAGRNLGRVKALLRSGNRVQGVQRHPTSIGVRGELVKLGLNKIDNKTKAIPKPCHKIHPRRFESIVNHLCRRTEADGEGPRTFKDPKLQRKKAEWIRMAESTWMATQHPNGPQHHIDV